MARDRGQRRRRRLEGRRNHAHHHLGACLDGMAGQCLRGRPEAAEGRLHRAHTGSTTPQRFHWHARTHHKHQWSHSKHQKGARWGIEPEVTGEGGNRGESNPRSPRRGSSHQFQLEEVVEEVGATVLPKRRRRRPPVMVGMVGRRRRWFRVCQRAQGGEGERVRGLGWVGWPTQTRAGLVQPGQVGWLGLMGQSPFVQINFKFQILNAVFFWINSNPKLK
jgi:hypothetical protein